MTPSPKSPKVSRLKEILVRSSLICLLAGALIFGLCLQKIEHLPLDGTATRFDSKQAFDFMATLSKKFPDRTTWSESRKRAAVWLKEQFSQMGYAPQGLQFSEVIAAHRYTGLENVYAIKRGTKHPDEIVAVAAHYDITDTTVEGAMDDASGVGVVLELARVFADAPTDRTLLFLVTDSEEFGAFWGAHSFAKDFADARKIVAVANFDFVAPEKQTKILTLCDGLKNGYTPLWLRELALDSASVRHSGHGDPGSRHDRPARVHRARAHDPARGSRPVSAGRHPLVQLGRPDGQLRLRDGALPPHALRRRRSDAARVLHAVRPGRRALAPQHRRASRGSRRL